MDEKDAPAAPPEPATPPAEAAAASPQDAPEDPLVMAPNTLPEQAPVGKVEKKRFPRFDKLWESMKRSFSGDDSDSVVPAGPVNRTRHRQPRVFFIDTGNASASQFAEAFARAEGLHAESGGTFPAVEIPPEAITAADEKGLNLREVRPKLIDPTRLHSFDRVVILGGSVPPSWREGARFEEWEVLNPAGLPLEGYRLVRDDVEKRVARMARLLKGRQAGERQAVARSR